MFSHKILCTGQITTRRSPPRTAPRTPSPSSRTRAGSPWTAARPSSWRGSWGSGHSAAEKMHQIISSKMKCLGLGLDITAPYQWLDTGEDGGDVVGGAPPVLEDVEADAAVRVDVGMEHLGQELHHRRLVGILLAELQGQLECSILTSVVRIKYILLGRQFWILQVREKCIFKINSRLLND